MNNNKMEGTFVLPLLLCVIFVTGFHAAAVSDYDDYSDEKITLPACDETNCQLPNCSCFGDFPKNVHRPQFVMLTFDDAITVANIETYNKILNGRRINATFFVCHEYNDYTLTNELYRQGHEIAIHTVSHESNTDLWRDGSEQKWKREAVDMRTLLNTFGGIPMQELVGFRAPFLQTGGNTTFKVLKKEAFLYDSSMPSRAYMDPPIWPYTLDFGYSQDCQIEPCPNENFPGLWEVPMIQYHRNSKDGDFYCSMLDACTPQPKTALDTKEFLMKNFKRHYDSNRAPFPVFLHEAWLRDKHRLEGFLQFFDTILTMEGVQAVTLRQVVEYMRHRVFPVRTPIQPCPKKEVCSYKEPLRIMKTCTTGCPKYYPWVGTPLGRRPPRDFPQ
nr:chitin deacetylase 8-like [Parasteatoda tepidariorum]